MQKGRAGKAQGLGEEGGGPGQLPGVQRAGRAGGAKRRSETQLQSMVEPALQRSRDRHAGTGWGRRERQTGSAGAEAAPPPRPPARCPPASSRRHLSPAGPHLSWSPSGPAPPLLPSQPLLSPLLCALITNRSSRPPGSLLATRPHPRPPCPPAPAWSLHRLSVRLSCDPSGRLWGPSASLWLPQIYLAPNLTPNQTRSADPSPPRLLLLPRRPLLSSAAPSGPDPAPTPWAGARRWQAQPLPSLPSAHPARKADPSAPHERSHR